MTLILGRLAAGDDLVEGIEAFAHQHGLTHAAVRSGPGSLVYGTLNSGGADIPVPGPGTEVLSLLGEVTPDGASLHGALGDPDGRVYAGRFVRGQNPICITLEFALEPR